MAGTDCCQKGLKSFIASKLGRCPRCIRAATLGMLAAWAGVGILYTAWPAPALLGIGLLVAVGFTLLFIAHLVALTVRLIALRRALVATEVTGRVGFNPGRRAVTVRVVRYGLATLLASVFGVGLFGRPRAAQASTCEENHLLDPFERLEASLCAPNETSAKAQAKGILERKGKKFAQAFCEPFSTPTCKQCNLKSAAFGALNCVETGPCKAAGKHWDCSLLLTNVECRCGGGRYTP